MQKDCSLYAEARIQTTRLANKGWQHYTVIDKTWGDRLMLMPIPTVAIDNNPLLADDQNPGY